MAGAFAAITKLSGKDKLKQSTLSPDTLEQLNVYQQPPDFLLQKRERKKDYLLKLLIADYLLFSVGCNF